MKQVVDPRAKPALCCGSANLLPSGDWVASWGYNDYMTELNRSGVPQITITYPGLFSYRAEISGCVGGGAAGGDECVASIPSTCDLPNWAQARSRAPTWQKDRSCGAVQSMTDDRAQLSAKNRCSIGEPEANQVRRPPRRQFQLIIGVLLLIGTVTVASTPARDAAAATPFSMSTSPALRPGFSAKITDYAVRCTTKSTTQLVTRGSGQVTVGGKAYTSPLSLALPLVAGQEVQVTFGAASYYIRCLPSSFPKYSASVPGHPQAPGYLVDLGNYTVAFDNTRRAGVVEDRGLETTRQRPRLLRVPQRDDDRLGPVQFVLQAGRAERCGEGHDRWGIGAPRHPRPRVAPQRGLSRVRAGHPRLPGRPQPVRESLIVGALVEGDDHR